MFLIRQTWTLIWASFSIPASPEPWRLRTIPNISRAGIERENSRSLTAATVRTPQQHRPNACKANFVGSLFQKERNCETAATKDWLVMLPSTDLARRGVLLSSRNTARSNRLFSLYALLNQREHQTHRFSRNSTSNMVASTIYYLHFRRYSIE